MPRSRVIIASLVGTSIEFYDFYIYATAAVSVFPLIFFAGGDDNTALLASRPPSARRSSRGRWAPSSSATWAIVWAARPRSSARC
ncbi:hypothetical protein GY12_13590 [Micrococcus luteus]|nr:hypothetical protein GY12_13590 [Micrococcus luteus]